MMNGFTINEPKDGWKKEFTAEEKAKLRWGLCRVL